MVMGNGASRFGRIGQCVTVGLLAGAAVMGAPAVAAIAAPTDSSPPAASSSSTTPPSRPDPDPAPTSADPKPAASANPTTSKPPKTASAQPGKAKPSQPEPDKPKKREKKKQGEEEDKQSIVDMGVVLAAAQRQLDTAKPDLARAQLALDVARRTADAARAELGTLRTNVTVTRAVTIGDRDQSALQGLSHALLPQVAAPTPASAPLVTMERLKAAESAATAADAAVARAKATYDLVRINVETAKATLGMASGALSPSAVAQQVRAYPVGECSFPGVRNPNDCRKAQRWAIEQTINPVKNWDHLCLNLVTMAYGWSSGAPTAIAMWNGLPRHRKQSPNTVAPPGALMFWGPNHVAMSLGNNMMVSSDVLGVGRAWIVSFETIQAVWGLQYLGWSAPDFGSD